MEKVENEMSSGKKKGRKNVKHKRRCKNIVNN